MAKQKAKKVEEKELVKEGVVAPKKLLIDIADLEDIKKEMAELKKQNAMLLETTDKRALENYFSKHQGEKKTEVRVRTIDGKIVIGWEEMPNNDVGTDYNTLRTVENQTVKILFSDGTSKVYSLLEFNKRFGYLFYVVMGIIKDDIAKTTTYKLISKEDGTELLISSKFIN